MIGIRKANSEGMVAATGGNDLLHNLGTNRSGVSRSAVIRKILAYNNTGGNVTLQLGSLTNAAAFAAYLPTLLVLNGLENVWEEHEIPAVEFSVDTTVAPGGSVGDIYMLASAANIQVLIEVEEFGS